MNRNALYNFLCSFVAVLVFATDIKWLSVNFPDLRIRALSKIQHPLGVFRSRNVFVPFRPGPVGA